MSCLILEQASPSTRVRLSASGLVKSYGTRRVVDAVSLEVRAGEALGLLGPNGAGKSTTMLMLAGVVRPDRGTVTLEGRSGAGRAGVRRLLGYAPQSLALYPELTALENLTLLARLYKVGRQELAARVQAALELAQLADRAHQRVRTFSGGMQRRLNLAAATVHAPSVLLLDEPTVGVDPQSMLHIYQSIEALKRRGMSIIYCTHHLQEAERLCDRVAIMDHGSILVTGTVRSLVDELGGGSLVEARMPHPPRAPDLKKYWKNGNFSHVTRNAKAVVDRLLGDRSDLLELAVLRPGLEGVFMSLTGRSMRDG